MAPVSFSWFEFLSEVFPITPENRTGPALLRVLLDQVVFSPICKFMHTIGRKVFTYLTDNPCSLGNFLHLHDIGRRRREKGNSPKVQCCLCSCFVRTPSYFSSRIIHDLT